MLESCDLEDRSNWFCNHYSRARIFNTVLLDLIAGITNSFEGKGAYSRGLLEVLRYVRYNNSWLTTELCDFVNLTLVDSRDSNAQAQQLQQHCTSLDSVVVVFLQKVGNDQHSLAFYTTLVPLLTAARPGLQHEEGVAAEVDAEQGRKAGASTKLDRLSRKAFPLSFVLFNCFYWTLVVYKKECR